MDDQRLMAIFMDIQSGLPRQGPGLDQMTTRALALCEHLPAQVTALDIGCGPGMQTLALARALSGHITAVDLMPEFLAQLDARAAEEGLADKITTSQQDMAALPYDDGSFDLIWSEAAAYSIGFENALTVWKPLLKAGGYLMASELVWLDKNPPADAKAFWAEEYPAMQHVDDVAALFAAAGYTLIDSLTLPDEGWWTYYYSPLSAKLPALRETYTGNAEALQLVEATATEIEMRRTHATVYGYQYFIARNE